jgi:hypothetical protein
LGSTAQDEEAGSGAVRPPVNDGASRDQVTKPQADRQHLDHQMLRRPARHQYSIAPFITAARIGGRFAAGIQL